MKKYFKYGAALNFLIVLILLISSAAAVAAPVEQNSGSVSFKDVADEDPNYLFIQYLADKGLVKGFPDGTFQPFQGLTRAEAAVILVKAANLQAGAVNPSFKDITPKFWAAGYIAAAKNAGLLSGYPDGTFRPNARLTRAEGIALIMRLSKEKDPAELPPLRDVNPEYWAARPIAVGLASGMVGLSADGQSFFPEAAFARGELARALAVILTMEPQLYQTDLNNRLNVLEGAVTVSRAGQPDPEVIKTGTELKPGDTVITGSGSAELVFADGSGLLLKQNTELIFKDSRGRSYIKKDGTAGNAIEWLNVELKRGKMFGALATSLDYTGEDLTQTQKVRAAALQAGAAGETLQGYVRALAAGETTPAVLPWWKASGVKRTKVKVDMPTGVAAIRGTFWQNSVEPDGHSTTTVLTGSAQVTAGGQTVDLAAGQRTVVTQSGAPPEKPAALTTQDKKEWVQQQTWANQRAQEIVTNQQPVLPPPPVATPQAVPQAPKDQPKNPAVQPPVSPLPVTPPPVIPSITDIIKDAIESAETAVNNTTDDNGGDSDSSTTYGVTTKQALIDAVASGGAEITLGADIDLGSDKLNINRPLAINGQNRTIAGSISLNVPGIVINNLTVSGDLVFGEGIGQGDATLSGVKVNGITFVEGGGSNSIHISDSALAAVFVNKNSGLVRVVAKGNTTIAEMNIESPVILATDQLAGTAGGIGDVIISENFQGDTGEEPEVLLQGPFQTVSSWASCIRLYLNSGTSIDNLILNNSTSVEGAGTVTTAEINAPGSSLAQRPQNLILTGEFTIVIGGETVSESFSSATTAELTGISATQASITVHLGSFVAGVTENDFLVSATIDGQPRGLEGLAFDSIHSRFTFSPIPLTDMTGKILQITVTPAGGGKITGPAKSCSVTVGTGFEGRITDRNKIGIGGVVINFRSGAAVTSGTIVGQATTDRYGYYSVSLPAGTYTGELVRTGFIPSSMVVTAPMDTYKTYQNSTVIKAGVFNEVMIVLSWGEQPEDEDSHLLGLAVGGNEFHTWYGDQTYTVDGTVYAELDVDDTNGYGREITTIRRLVDGKYTFYVQNYSNEVPLRGSNTMVRVYLGDALTPSHTFTVPGGTGNEEYWTVFEMDVSQNGQTINIAEIGLMSAEIPLLDVKEEFLGYLDEALYQVQSVTVGDQPGNYPQEAVDLLNAAIAQAQSVFNDSAATLDQLNAAMEELLKALDDFFAAVIPPLPQQSIELLGYTDIMAVVGLSVHEGAATVEILQSSDGGNTWNPAVTDAPLDSSSTGAKIVGLAPDTSYVFRLVSGGEFGQVSSDLEVTTKPALIGPTNVGVIDLDVNVGLDGRDFQVSWTPGSGGQQRIYILPAGVGIDLTSDSGQNWVFATYDHSIDRWTGPVAMLHDSLGNPLAEVAYEVYVLEYNGRGVGQHPDPFTPHSDTGDSSGTATIATVGEPLHITGQIVEVLVTDTDLNTDSGVQQMVATAVRVTSSSTDPTGITIDLFEDGTDSGIFKGQVTIVPPSDPGGVGQIRAGIGELIKFEYTDAHDSNGNFDVLKQTYITVTDLAQNVAFTDADPGSSYIF